MIKLSMYQKVKNYKDAGCTLKEIASRTGLDVKTIKKYSKMTLEQYQEYYASFHLRVKCFDQYEAEIINIFKNSNIQKVSAAAIYDRLEEKHGVLPASERSFRSYFAYLRTSGKLQQEPHRLYEPVDPLPMGRQMQLDFGEYRMKDGQKYYILAAILSASRCRYVKLFDRPLTTRDLIKGLCDCFTYYGGMPHEICIDQDRLMVVDENKGDVILTREFQQYRDEMGFDLYVCRKADPESKGKVENLVNFVKRSFFSTRSFSDLEEARERLIKWLARRANGKKCAATGRQPYEHLNEERRHLKSLRNSIFFVADKEKRELRKVDKLGQVSVRGAKLRLPSEYASKTVSVFIGAEEVHIFQSLNASEPIAVYSMITGLSLAPIVRQKSLRKRRSDDLKKALFDRFHFREWKQFVAENFKRYSRYCSDQYNDFMKKFSKEPDMQAFTEAVKYCLANNTVSMSMLYDTYISVFSGKRLEPEIQAKSYKLLSNKRYISPVVATRKVESYTKLITVEASVEVKE
jgi:hypothetical protein